MIATCQAPGCARSAVWAAFELPYDDEHTRAPLLMCEDHAALIMAVPAASDLRLWGIG